MANGKKNGGLLAAGVVGAVIGAVGSLVGIFLSDEKNREKVVKEAKTLKNEGARKIKDMEAKAFRQVKKSVKRVSARRK